MPRKAKPIIDADTLRSFALKYPETEEGASCTRSSFKARKKGFLYIGDEDGGFNVLLKLRDSLDEAAELEKKSPDLCKVGVHGWVTLRFEAGKKPPKGLLEKWVDESFRISAPKKLVALLPDDSSPG